MVLDERDDSIREDGYGRAVDLLRECATKHGFLATPTERENYRRVWGRDGSIMSVAAAGTADEELLTAARSTFETLLRHQGPHGEIPSNVDPDTGRISYGGTAGRVDADLWLVIGIGEYWIRSADDEFLERHLPALEKTRFLLGAWEFNNRGLLYVPLTGDWADEYLQHGYVLYDQLLNLQAQRCFAAFHRHVSGAPDHDLEQRIQWLRQTLRANFWFYPDGHVAPEHMYHEILYDKGRDAAGRCAGRHWTPFFSPTGYGYRFDTFANVLASVLDVADDDQRRSVDEVIDGMVSDRLPLLPAFHPVIEPVDDDWEELQMTFSYTFKNKPYEYHNGGLWPLLTGFYAADLARRGLGDRAVHFARALHRGNALEMDGEDWSFPEYVHGQKLTASGVRHQGWSAAAAVIAENAIAERKVFACGQLES
jgi:hypothetical protein